MHRATPSNSSFRAFSAGGSRATVNKVDDNKLMQESSANMMKNETRKGIECPQNIGFTSVAHAKKEGSPYGAEMNISYAGGNRSFPTGGNMDNRDQRLRGLSEGDSAMHGPKDRDQQIHMAGDGTYLSHQAGGTLRMQLVPAGSSKANAPQSKAKASQAQQDLYAAHSPTPEFEDRLWAGLEPDLQDRLQIELDRIEGRSDAEEGMGVDGGGAGTDGGGGDAKKNKPTGQKAVKDAGKDSKEFMHVKGDESRLSHGKKVQLSNGKEDGDVLHESSGKQDYVGGTPSQHQFGKIVTVKGISINGHAQSGEPSKPVLISDLFRT